MHDNDPGQAQGLLLGSMGKAGRQVRPKGALAAELALRAADIPKTLRVADQPAQIRLQALDVLQLGPLDVSIIRCITPANSSNNGGRLSSAFSNRIKKSWVCSPEVVIG